MFPPYFPIQRTWNWFNVSKSLSIDRKEDFWSYFDLFRNFSLSVSPPFSRLTLALSMFLCDFSVKGWRKRRRVKVIWKLVIFNLSQSPLRFFFLCFFHTPLFFHFYYADIKDINQLLNFLYTFFSLLFAKAK